MIKTSIQSELMNENENFFFFSLSSWRFVVCTVRPLLSGNPDEPTAQRLRQSRQLILAWSVIGHMHRLARSVTVMKAQTIVSDFSEDVRHICRDWEQECFLRDYRCEDGQVPKSTSCVKISNPNSLFSSERGFNPGRRSWRKHLSEWASCQKAVGGIHFTKKWATQKKRAETLKPGLEVDFSTPA